MRDCRDFDDNDDTLPYRRPAMSAWIAAAAVAMAVFLLGGFIKTYRQLESLREDSRREIQELRQAVSSLQQSSGRTAHVHPSRPSGIRIAPLPRAESRSAPASSTADEPPRPAASALPPVPEDDSPGRSRVTYSVGRRSSPEDLAGLQGQVASVSASSKRLMVEGGRDVGLNPGARLEIYRDGRWVGDLRVLDVYGNQSACEVLHSTSAPLPGDMVRLPPK